MTKEDKMKDKTTRASQPSAAENSIDTFDPALAIPDPVSSENISAHVQGTHQHVAEAGGYAANIDSSEEPAHETKQSTSEPPQTLPRRRRKRAEKCMILDEKSSKTPGLVIPSNQYERVLIRRAVRKSNHDDTTDRTGNNTQTQRATLDLYGDVSLGMKLTVIAGKVIVQNITCLADGRASPAQLAGSIRRGDVLLAINDYSLVNLPFEQLMRGLTPLSTPNPDGIYQRILRLRFLVADGIGLLERNDAAKEAAHEANQHVNAANEMFGLFPMVDQLGGFHYGENDSLSLSFSSPIDAAIYNPPAVAADMTANENEAEPKGRGSGKIPSKGRPPLEDDIAKHIATDRLKDKERFVSEFFSWSDEASDVLRSPDESALPCQQHSEEKTVSTVHQLSLAHVLERGKRALIGAKALSDRIESIDNGRNDVRSFKSWTTTISLYSRASARRKLVHDGASLPVNFGRLDEHEDEDDDEEIEREAKSDMSAAQDMDADELLVQMAAHDEIWRRQVIDFFKKYIKELDEPEDTSHQASIDEHNLTDMDTAMSNELGQFLFGDSMSRIIKKGGRSVALPPDDVTLVLFDLTTKICATIPHQITAAGSTTGLGNVTPFASRDQPLQKGSDSFLATHFLLSDALPLWLESFHPLPWEQRRLLWPIDREPIGSSTTASTLSDELSTDSMSASQRTQHLLQRKRKNLRERIEEKELNAETRAATCFLATFYFVQRIIPQLVTNQECGSTRSFCNEGLEDEVIAFITRYGSYLKLHTCLISASPLRARRVTDALLNLAKHDPRHKEAMKQLSKASSLVFYEPTMLSAVMQLLFSLRSHAMQDHRLPVIDLCVAAFPDITPWQVKEACGVCAPASTFPDPSQLEFDDLYYIYLAQLLHPVDGYEAARRDSSLVGEWCRLSLYEKCSGTFDDRSYDRMANFLTVTSDRVTYKRDLPVLLDMAMDKLLYNVSLDLAAEVVRAGGYHSALDSVLPCVRKIALNALETGLAQLDQLRQIIDILMQASRTNLIFSIPDEFVNWIDHQAFSRDRVLEVILFLAAEARPADVLASLLLWTEKSKGVVAPDLLPTLRLLLSRAAEASVGSELSGSLLQIHQARRALTRSHQDAATQSATIERGIWQRMSNGVTNSVDSDN